MTNVAHVPSVPHDPPLPSVVSNVEDRLKFLRSLSEEQFERQSRQLAYDLTAAVLVLSKGKS